MINFSDQEIKRAWRQNAEAYDTSKNSPTNAHRLLLFYAVECGLKAVLMKRRRQSHTNSCLEEFKKAQHDLNKLLDLLNAGTDLRLPDKLYMQPLRGEQDKRKCTSGDLNQMWRYGGCSKEECPDKDLEKN